MGKLYDEITPDLRAWIEKQRMYFVATAPSGAGDQRNGGHVNCSPKGLDSFRVLGPRSVGYLDLTGSGAETIAHLRENGRICIMFCAFEGPPKILRLHGKGTYLTPDDAEWQAELAKYKPLAGARAIIQVECTRISDSCGFGVPIYETPKDRATLLNWADKKGQTGVVDYQQKNNLLSIDGLPALEPIE